MFGSLPFCIEHKPGRSVHFDHIQIRVAILLVENSTGRSSRFQDFTEVA